MGKPTIDPDSERSAPIVRPRTDEVYVDGDGTVRKLDSDEAVYTCPEGYYCSEEGNRKECSSRVPEGCIHHGDAAKKAIQDGGRKVYSDRIEMLDKLHGGW